MPNCTVRYAAPEVAASRQRNQKLAVTTAVDTWAVALILHELFSGEPLLDDEVTLAWLSEHSDEIVAKVREHPNLTDAQRRLLMEMLKVKPEERCTLREVLSKGYFKTGEDTEEAKHVEVPPHTSPTPAPQSSLLQEPTIRHSPITNHPSPVIATNDQSPITHHPPPVTTSRVHCRSSRSSRRLARRPPARPSAHRTCRRSSSCARSRRSRMASHADFGRFGPPRASLTILRRS